MEWSLSLLFGLILLVLILFKKCEEFKGGRIRMGSGRIGRDYSKRPFDMVDAVVLVLAFYYLFLNN
jgi:hypothetical protein